MKKTSFITLAIMMVAVVFIGCGKKDQVAEIKELGTFNDPAGKFSLKYPADWKKGNVPGESFVAYSSAGIEKRISDNYSPDGAVGAKVSFVSHEIEAGTNVDSLLLQLIPFGEIFTKPEQVTVDGVSIFKRSYKFPLNDGDVEGHIYYGCKDPKLMSILWFESFGGTYETYKPHFEEIVKSIKLAATPQKKTDTVKETVIQELPKPSSNLVTSSGTGFSMLVPDNFDRKSPKDIQNAIACYNFIGERRRDCNVRIDIFDAKKKSVDKLAEDAKAGFKGASPRAGTVGGQKAMIFDFSVDAQVKSRVYMVVNNGKLFRIRMNWATEEEADYKPIFEKMVNSFAFN